MRHRQHPASHLVRVDARSPEPVLRYRQQREQRLVRCCRLAFRTSTRSCCAGL